MTPKPESRISALEQRAATLEASIVELSSDTAEELRAIHQHVDQGFDQAHAFVQERFEEINTRLERVEQDIRDIKATMATKDDMTAMESRINANIATMKEDLLDAIKQLWQQRPSE